MSAAGAASQPQIGVFEKGVQGWSGYRHAITVFMYRVGQINCMYVQLQGWGNESRKVLGSRDFAGAVSDRTGVVT